MAVQVVKAYAGFVGDECQTRTVFPHERGAMVNMLHTRGGLTVLASMSDERIREEWIRRRAPDWEIRPVAIVALDYEVADSDLLVDHVRRALVGG